MSPLDTELSFHFQSLLENWVWTAVQLEGNWSCPQLCGALAAIWSMPHGSWTTCLWQNITAGEQQQPELLWHAAMSEALLLLGWGYQTLHSGKKLQSAKSNVHPQMETTSGKLRMIQGNKQGLHSLVWAHGTEFSRKAALWHDFLSWDHASQPSKK